MTNLPVVNNSRDTSNITQFVTFTLNYEEYGVEVLKVREIIRMVSITTIPDSPGHIEGIINLRGKVIPIVSLRTAFGLPLQPDNKLTRVVIMETCGSLFGYTVDSVSEVVRVPAREILPSPALAAGSKQQEYITGVIHHEKKLLVLLDLDKMYFDKSSLDN